MSSQRIQVYNATRETWLVEDGRAARGFWPRLRGLIGHEPLARGQGLLLDPGKSIHTCFMGFPIDVVYLDEDHVVRGLDRDLKPWRIGGFYSRVRRVLELPVGAIEASNTQEGDRLEVRGADGG
ncbi:MAG: DUF192 domain-containing protein [Anaerolineae bacterium]